MSNNSNCKEGDVKNTVSKLMNIRQFSWYVLGVIIFIFIGSIGAIIGFLIIKLLIELNIK